MKKLVVYRTLADTLLTQLRQHFDVTYFEFIDDSNRSAFIDAIKDTDALLGATLSVGRSLLSNATKVKAIASISVGYDNFDIDYLTERGIVLCNTPHVLTEATADTVFALVLSTARRVVELAELVKAGQWLRSVDTPEYGVNVYGKTLGIMGMGRIGQAIARRAHLGFGMNVLYHNRNAVPEAEQALHARKVTLDELLTQSDFVCNMLPLSPATQKLIGAREFALMKRSGIFINGGRGATVDEAALIEALRNGTIHGAGLDVFEVEPLPASSPLLKMKNVVALPHIGSATHETRFAMAQLSVDNIIAAFTDKPQNVVNPSALQRRN